MRGQRLSWHVVGKKAEVDQRSRVGVDNIVYKAGSEEIAVIMRLELVNSPLGKVTVTHRIYRNLS